MVSAKCYGFKEQRKEKCSLCEAELSLPRTNCHKPSLFHEQTLWNCLNSTNKPSTKVVLSDHCHGARFACSTDMKISCRTAQGLTKAFQGHPLADTVINIIIIWRRSGFFWRMRASLGLACAQATTLYTQVVGESAKPALGHERGDQVIEQHRPVLDLCLHFHRIWPCSSLPYLLFVYSCCFCV